MHDLARGYHNPSSWLAIAVQLKLCSPFPFCVAWLPFGAKDCSAKSSALSMRSAMNLAPLSEYFLHFSDPSSALKIAVHSPEAGQGMGHFGYSGPP